MKKIVLLGGREVNLYSQEEERVEGTQDGF